MKSSEAKAARHRQRTQAGLLLSARAGPTPKEACNPSGASPSSHLDLAQHPQRREGGGGRGVCKKLEVEKRKGGSLNYRSRPKT